MKTKICWFSDNLCQPDRSMSCHSCLHCAFESVPAFLHANILPLYIPDLPRHIAYLLIGSTRQFHDTRCESGYQFSGRSIIIFVAFFAFLFYNTQFSYNIFHFLYKHTGVRLAKKSIFVLPKYLINSRFLDIAHEIYSLSLFRKMRVSCL